MKKLLNLWLTAALVCGLALSVTSCKDDDDTPSEEQQQQEQQQADERDQAWTVLSQLIDPTTADVENWTAGTYEATIGEADTQNALNRVVMTNTLANAAQRFANIIGLETLDSTTATYTYTNPQLGTLTYQRSQDGLSLATVTVDVKQLPGLRQIVYTSPDLSGKNGWLSKFDGRAYYRFGDVVRKTVKGVYEYWVCVRPSFGPEGKGDSHWVTFSQLRYENMKEKDVNGKKFTMPKALGTDKENMENLGEMLCCMLDYNSYDKYIYNRGGKYYFHDFNVDNFPYHNDNFWGIVAEGWEKNGVARDVFGPDVDSNAQLKDIITRGQLHLIYDDPSWSWFGYKCTMKQATLANFANGLRPQYTTKTCDMEQIDHFDAYKFSRDDQKRFFGNDEPHWFIRHATGKQLIDGAKYDAKKSLGELCPDVMDVFVYYRYLSETRGFEFNLKLDPELTQDLEYRFPDGFEAGTRPYYMVGDVLYDNEDNRWICLRPSSPKNGNTYSYFVSFDKVINSRGRADFTQLPQLRQAKHMAFFILNYVHDVNYHPEMIHYPFKYQVKHMRDFADFDIDEYVVMRDSIFNTINHDPILGTEIRGHFSYDPIWVNLLYKGDDGKPYILRLFCRQLVGGKEIESVLGSLRMDYQLHYPTDQTRLMSIADTYSQAMVDQYANTDVWALCERRFIDADDTHKTEVEAYLNKFKNEFYHNENEQVDLAQTGNHPYYTLPSPGFRTKAAKNNDAQWLMTGMGKMNSLTAKEGINMWREPVMSFAVKRLRDDGKRAFQFEDGTKIIQSRLNDYSSLGKRDESYSYLGILQSRENYWTANIYVDGVKGRDFDWDEPIQ